MEQFHPNWLKNRKLTGENPSKADLSLIFLELAGAFPVNLAA
jgi:hypothetical protein